MKMNFSKEEIVSMIDFALKNQGAPAQIAQECETTDINELKRDGFEITVVTGMEVELLPDRNEEKKEEPAPAGGLSDPRKCPECGDAFVPNSGRQKYCGVECREARNKRVMHGEAA